MSFDNDVKVRLMGLVMKYEKEASLPDVDTGILEEIKSEIKEVSGPYLHLRRKEIFRVNKILVASPFQYESCSREAAVGLSNVLLRHPRIDFEEGEKALGVPQYRELYQGLTTWDPMPWER